MQEWFFRSMIPGPFNVGLHYDPLAQYNANRVLQQNAGNAGVLQGIRSTLGSPSRKHLSRRYRRLPLISSDPT